MIDREINMNNRNKLYNVVGIDDLEGMTFARCYNFSNYKK